MVVKFALAQSTVTHLSFAQGDEWPVGGREPEEQFMFVYGTSMDDFNYVTQASQDFECLPLCLGST